MKWYELAALAVAGWLLWGDKRARADERPVAETRKEVLDAFEAKGYPRAEADWVVRIESGWKPDAVNPKTHAVGLIQFMPKSLGGLGFTGGWQEFARLTIGEQVPWIKRFLATKQRWGYPGDTYVLVAAPSFVGMPDDVVVYPIDSPAWKANSLWHDPGEPVTVGSLRRVLLSRMTR